MNAIRRARGRRDAPGRPSRARLAGARTATIAVVMAVACGDGERGSRAAEPTSSPERAVEPARATRPPAQPTTAQGASEPPRPTSARPDPSTPEGARTLEAFGAALREGRQDARAGRQEAAIEAFGRALELVDDPRARCELGWAQLRAGRVGDAARTLDRALAGLREGSVPAARRATVAACLYNRGRVAEAQDDRVTAARAYRSSLALRPSATVEAALAGLGEVLVPEPECIQICEGPLPSRAALRAAMETALARHHATIQRFCSSPDDGARWRSERSAPAAGPFEEAYLAAFFTEGACLGGPERSVAVVEARLASGWAGCAVLEASGGINESVDIGAEDVLVVRGNELAARPRVYHYEVELAQMCMQCEDPSECEETCDYETFTPVETVLVVRDGRLAPRVPACLLP